MEIKTKFNIGDKVYVVFTLNERKTTACPDCGGEKYLLSVSGKKIKCHECCGRGDVGLLYKKARLLFEDSRKVTKICSKEARVSLDKMSLIYDIEGYSSAYIDPDPMKLNINISEDMIFYDKEIALQYIKEINE